MINEKNIKKYASTVLLKTVDELFDNKKELIDNFYSDFIKNNKRNKNLKNNYKDNEVVDELILEELEKKLHPKWYRKSTTEKHGWRKW